MQSTTSQNAVAYLNTATDAEADAAKPTFLHHGQLVVQNDGSTTRDFLAYERNFLSWMKLVATCMVISGALLIRLHLSQGVGSEQSSPLENRFAIPGGSIFFAVALLSLVAATMSFFSTQKELLRGAALISSGRFVQFTSILVTLVIGASCVVLIISSEQT